MPPRQGAVKPSLVWFREGSLEGFCAMLYAVWPRPAGGSEVFLLMAKSRVSPLGGTTVPRMEISSGALLSRLALLVARVCGFKLVKIVIALDSECSVSALTRYKGLIKPYFAHGAGEVNEAVTELQNICPSVDPMVAIPGEENPADIGTRSSATEVDISPTSRWQCGPEFLQQPRRAGPLRIQSVHTHYHKLYGTQCTLQPGWHDTSWRQHPGPPPCHPPPRQSPGSTTCPVLPQQMPPDSCWQGAVLHKLSS